MSSINKLDLGFSSPASLSLDLQRELERRSRGGQPFAVVLMRIHKIEEKTTVLKAFRSITRIFDDIYACDDPREVLLCLKHCDSKGAFRFIDRLKFQLIDMGAGKDFFDLCVAEPIPGDDLDVMLRHVKDDLDRLCVTGPGEAGEYKDISPLRRYVDGLKSNGDARK